MKIQKLKLEMDGWMSLWAFVTDFAAMHPFFWFCRISFFFFCISDRLQFKRLGSSTQFPFVSLKNAILKHFFDCFEFPLLTGRNLFTFLFQR